jgi:hypothetical protein
VKDSAEVYNLNITTDGRVWSISGRV